MSIKISSPLPMDFPCKNIPLHSNIYQIQHGSLCWKLSSGTLLSDWCFRSQWNNGHNLGRYKTEEELKNKKRQVGLWPFIHVPSQFTTFYACQLNPCQFFLQLQAGIPPAPAQRSQLVELLRKCCKAFRIRHYPKAIYAFWDSSCWTVLLSL